MTYGDEPGAVCNRPVNGEDCQGMMEAAPAENCSCHISPPCGECVEAGVECDRCGALSREDR